MSIQIKPYRKIFLVVETTNHFGRNIVEGIAQYALERHWRLDFRQRGCFDPVHLETIPSDVDGVISRTFDRRFAQKLMQLRVPVVELVGEYGAPQDVLIDETALSQMVFNHFRERGIENFGAFSDVRAIWSVRRMNAFKEIVRQAGFFYSEYIPSRHSGNFLLPNWTSKQERDTISWIIKLPKPCGILLGQDIQAKRFYECCLDAGARIPEDVAVVGNENDRWFCEALSPPLSSVEQNGVQFGMVAAQLLEQKMACPEKTFEPIFLSPSHVQVRQSSAITAIKDEDVRESIAYIREHLSQGVKPEDVVNHVNVSIRKLQREFKRLLDVTPQQFILNMQMTVAKQLLLDSRISLRAVSEAAGFNSVEYFTRVFTREIGCSPGRYREGKGGGEKI
ncbi:MAG: substrate-binding domain-containing protein [Thermoguttaceae bacterium]|nr:substrate-binding domain-containing protein [Thermoguttaceae bacterium]